MKKSDNERFFIAALGASSGGLTALKGFFSHISANLPVAFVVLTHIRRDRMSRLDQLIAHMTAMPVVSVRSKVKVEPGNIYVLPENVFITIEDGMLVTRKRKISEIINWAVNIFFESLAKYAGPNAIGIVLSGAGSDGLEGVKAIESAGGYVMVQHPDDARYKEMPQTVITKDKPHVIERTEQLAEELVSYIQRK